MDQPGLLSQHSDVTHASADSKKRSNKSCNDEFILMLHKEKKGKYAQDSILFSSINEECGSSLGKKTCFSDSNILSICSDLTSSFPCSKFSSDESSSKTIPGSYENNVIEDEEKTIRLEEYDVDQTNAIFRRNDRYQSAPESNSKTITGSFDNKFVNDDKKKIRLEEHDAEQTNTIFRLYSDRNQSVLESDEDKIFDQEKIRRNVDCDNKIDIEKKSFIDSTAEDCTNITCSSCEILEESPDVSPSFHEDFVLGYDYNLSSLSDAIFEKELDCAVTATIGAINRAADALCQANDLSHENNLLKKKMEDLDQKSISHRGMENLTESPALCLAAHDNLMLVNEDSFLISDINSTQSDEIFEKEIEAAATATVNATNRAAEALCQVNDLSAENNLLRQKLKVQDEESDLLRSKLKELELVHASSLAEENKKVQQMHDELGEVRRKMKVEDEWRKWAEKRISTLKNIYLDISEKEEDQGTKNLVLLQDKFQKVKIQPENEETRHKPAQEMDRQNVPSTAGGGNKRRYSWDRAVASIKSLNVPGTGKWMDRPSTADGGTGRRSSWDRAIASVRSLDVSQTDEWVDRPSVMGESLGRRPGRDRTPTSARLLDRSQSVRRRRPSTEMEAEDGGPSDISAPDPRSQGRVWTPELWSADDRSPSPPKNLVQLSLLGRLEQSPRWDHGYPIKDRLRSSFRSAEQFMVIGKKYMLNKR